MIIVIIRVILSENYIIRARILGSAQQWLVKGF